MKIHSISMAVAVACLSLAACNTQKNQTSLPSSSSQNVIDNLYSFDVPLNGKIETEFASATVQPMSPNSGKALHVSFEGDVAEALEYA